MPVRASTQPSRGGRAATPAVALGVWSLAACSVSSPPDSEPRAEDGGRPITRDARSFDGGSAGDGGGDSSVDAGPARADAGVDERRNVVLILLDDYGVDAAPFYPDEARIETTPAPPPMPNLTQLAEQGVIFETAWSYPTCAPTRATIFTGRFGFRTGIGSRQRDASYPDLPLEEFGLPEAVIAATDDSYALTNIGKFHLNNEGDDLAPNRHGWPDYRGSVFGRVPDYFSRRKVINGRVTQSTEYVTTDQINDAVAFIERADSEQKPFFLWLGLNGPHTPFHLPPAHLHSYGDLPDIRDDPPEELWRPYFEAMCESVDTELGRLFARIDFRTTTVIVMGDNGTQDIAIASPHEPLHAKGTVYETGVRVPLLIAGRGVTARGQMVTRFVHSVDLYPTILELLGVDVGEVLPEGTVLDGISYVRYLTDPDAPPIRERLYAEKFQQTWETRVERALRDERYKLLTRFSGQDEFFDLERDPLETRNLLDERMTEAQSEAHRRLRAEMEALLGTR